MTGLRVRGDHGAVLAPGPRRHRLVDPRADQGAGGRPSDLEVIGIAARHREPPLEPWVPTIPVRHLALPRDALYEAWHRFRWPGIARATGRVDVVHATAVAFPPTRDAPVVATVHDLAFLDDRELATRHGHRFFRRGMELARAEATVVMVPSEAARAACLRNGFDAARLRVVPWGITPLTVSTADVDRVLGRYGIERPYVLFCGTHEPRKNLRRVVEAFRRLGRTTHELVLVGPEGWNEDVRSLLAGLDGRAKVLGFVPRSDLDPLYRAATVFCYPSLQEGFGLPVLEAMAQGTPVVTSAGTATEEVAGDAGLLVDPTDTAAIAAAIEVVVDDHGIAERLGRAGRRRAGEFTWGRTAELVVAAYREAAGDGPG